MPPKLDYESVSALAWRLTAALLLLPLLRQIQKNRSLADELGFEIIKP